MLSEGTNVLLSIVQFYIQCTCVGRVLYLHTFVINNKYIWVKAHYIARHFGCLGVHFNNFQNCNQFQFICANDGMGFTSIMNSFIKTQWKIFIVKCLAFNLLLTFKVIKKKVQVKNK